MKKLILLSIFGLLLLAGFGQTITLKWNDGGSVTYTQTFDEIYGYNKPTSLKCGIMVGDELKLGQEAYQWLTQPVWGDGETFASMIPTLTPYPDKYILVEGTTELYYPASKPTVPGNYTCYIHGTDGDMLVTLSYETEALGVWELLHVYKFKLGTGTTSTYIINPDWLAVDQLRMQEKQEFRNFISSYFTLVGKYNFPNIPTCGTCKWWVKQPNGRFTPTPVVPGKYPLYTWLPVPDGSTNDIWRVWTQVYVNISDKDYIIRSLLKL